MRTSNAILGLIFLAIVAGVLVESGTNGGANPPEISSQSPFIDITFVEPYRTITGGQSDSAFCSKVTVTVPSYDYYYDKDILYCDISWSSSGITYKNPSGSTIGSASLGLSSSDKLSPWEHTIYLDCVDPPTSTSSITIYAVGNMWCTWTSGEKRPTRYAISQQKSFSYSPSCPYSVLDTYCVGSSIYQEVRNTDCTVDEVFVEKCEDECINGQCFFSGGWVSGEYCKEGDLYNIYKKWKNTDGSLEDKIVGTCTAGATCEGGQCVPASGFIGEPYCDTSDLLKVYNKYRTSDGVEEVRVFEVCEYDYECKAGACVFISSPPDEPSEPDVLLWGFALAALVLAIAVLGWVILTDK